MSNSNRYAETVAHAPHHRSGLKESSAILIRRYIFLILGMICTGIGITGIFVPGLPGVVFLIIAAACFARSNPALEQRILEHPKYGPPILDWREKGIVRRKAKWSATWVFAFTIVATLIIFPLPLAAVPPAACVIVGTWLWTRPEE